MLKHSFYLFLIIFIIDLFLVKNINYIFDNFGERFAVNLFFSIIGSVLLIISISRLNKIWQVFIISIPLIIEANYFNIYNKLITPFGIKTFFEDGKMVLDLTFNNINYIKSIFIFLIIYISITILLNNQTQIKTKNITISIISLSILYIFSLFSWYSLTNAQNSLFAFYGSIFETLKNGKNINKKISRPNLTKIERDKNNLPNIIYIIGESATLSHTFFGNYERDTTPNLKKLAQSGDLIAFNNAISIGTKTRLSVPYMSVGLTGIDPKGEIYKYPTILNYAKSVGYETYLISSQDLSWGGLRDFLLDRDVDKFVNGTDVNPNARVHKGADDLEMIQKHIYPIIEKNDKPFFILFQMDGNHYPYSKHSPDNFKIWQENGENSVEAFDNSMRYSDYVLNELIIKLRSKFKNSWLFYSADHGQNFGNGNGMFNDNFSLNIVHNLFFISAPENNRTELIKKIDSPISQADIVPTILDILNIEPIYKLDGISLFKNIDKNRLRISSNYMPTLHNNPEASIFFPDLTSIEIDFSHNNAKLPNNKIIKLNDLNETVKSIFQERLK